MSLLSLESQGGKGGPRVELPSQGGKGGPRVELPLLINDQEVLASYAREDVEGLFLPFLRELTSLRDEARAGGRRVVAFLAAPPGAGKSTLASFLQGLSCGREGLAPLQALGMDGFHRPNVWLDAHHLGDDPAAPSLRSVKGAPQTFDVEALEATLRRLRAGERLRWPSYSRATHDVCAEGPWVESEVVLVEGNYLLLDEPGWRGLRELCDVSVMLREDSEVLHRRLVARKVAGGSTPKEAEAHYQRSDRRNVELVLGHSLPADHTWHLG